MRYERVLYHAHSHTALTLRQAIVVRYERYCKIVALRRCSILPIPIKPNVFLFVRTFYGPAIYFID